MQTIDQAATALAHQHYLIEPSITQIFRMDVNGSADPARPRPVGLLEVNQDTIASGVVPLYFGPSAAAGIPFPSVIVEITPEELSSIQNNELKLPQGWIVRELIPRGENGAHP